MFQARRTDTSAVIESEELKVISKPTEINFVCVDPQCAIELIPCSYGDVNKRRPFFKKRKKTDHSAACDYSSYLNYLEVGKTRSLTSIELEKMDYPSRLVIHNPYQPTAVNSTTIEDIQLQKISQTRRVDSGEYSEAIHSNRKVTSINKIVEFYLDCPYNRGVDLDLLGNVAPYKFQFKRIKDENIGDYIDNKIFYGIINLNDMDAVYQNEGKTFIRMHECERWEEIPRSIFKKKRRVNPYIVEIDNNSISDYKLSSILRSRETVANESKNLFFANRKKEKEEAYIFFLGHAPKNNNPYTFKAIGGFVAFRYTKVIHPKDTRQT